LLEVRNVRKIFESPRGNYHALEAVTLSIAEGEFVCLLGPSGCGKSTLLNIIAGFVPVTGGQVTFENKPVLRADRARVMLFQDANSALLPWLSVEENIRFALRVRKIAREQWPQIVDTHLRMVSLDTHRGKFPAELSGGMRQRLQIARALAVDPKMLLMDEPFAALDAQTRDMLHDELERIWKETAPTIVFVTHNVREAVRLGDRVLLMSFRPGRIKTQFQVTLNRPRHVEDSDVAYLSKEILGQLREEIDRSFNAEYSREEKR